MKLTPMGKIVALILVFGLAAGAYRYWGTLAPAKVEKPSGVPTVGDLPTANDKTGADSGDTTPDINFTETGEGAGCPTSPEVRVLGYAWNGQLGMLLASGGAQATKGSLMCKNGVNMKWARQDDNSKLQEALVTFATELDRGNPNPKKGAHFVTIMGDGGAAFIKPLNDSLRKIGPEYTAKIVGAIGYSRGEDKFMGPAAWRDNPEAARGGLVAGVLRDGDWNIAQKWLADNEIKTNPDEKTWDPDALNWVAANDYLDAVEKYVAGYTETRPVVRNGKRTGETKKITVNGVVTWTPGDVSVAKKKGGLVSIISTKEYDSQMPTVVIGIDKWCKSNRRTVENYLLACAQGAEQIQKSDAALNKATQVAAKLFNEPDADAAYWKKYFKGVTEPDAQGIPVELGGSSVNNLGQSLIAFGLAPGSSNLVATTYTVFGNLVVSQYPEFVPSFDPASQVVDGSYYQALSKRLTAPQRKVIIAKAQPKYTPGRVRKVVSRRQWNIQFNAGKATFTPQAKQQLERLARDLLIAGGTVVEVHGHTDNSGDPRTSMPLSESRAFAVKSYLERLSPVNFPRGRVRAFAHGETQPLVPNTTPANRVKNRRVEIVLRQA